MTLSELTNTHKDFLSGQLETKNVSTNPTAKVRNKTKNQFILKANVADNETWEI